MGETVTIRRKRREIFLKCESVEFRMWQQRGKGPDLVALGPVVITFHHKPQWWHKGPGAQGGFYIYNHHF